MNKTKIAFATDHAAAPIRNNVKEYIIGLGYEVEDFGYSGDGSCDYPDYASKAAKAIAQGKADKGIFLCGTGIGMAIAANKIKGVIAATVWSEDTARLAAQHNKADIACMGSRTNTMKELCDMARVFLTTEFEERHKPRVDKIKALEQ
jgi:ribose 5-phosphate isomerase B